MAYDGVGLWLGTEDYNSYRSNNEVVFYRFNLTTGIQDRGVNINPEYPKTLEIYNTEIIFVITERVDD